MIYGSESVYRLELFEMCLASDEGFNESSEISDSKVNSNSCAIQDARVNHRQPGQ